MIDESPEAHIRFPVVVGFAISGCGWSAECPCGPRHGRGGQLFGPV